MNLHKAYWSVVDFPLEIFIWLWYKDKAEAGLKEGVRRCFLHFNLFEHFENDCSSFLFKCMLEFTNVPM